MKQITIDTNVYTAFKNSDPQVIETLQHCERIGIDVTVLAEIFSGFAMGTREQHNCEELYAFLETPRVSILPHDLTIAEHYAAIVKQLKRQGRPIPTNDIWIAANAMKHALTVYSFDEHFHYLEGVTVFP